MTDLKTLFDKTIKYFIKNGIEKNESELETLLLIENVFGNTRKDLIINPSQKLPENKLDFFYSLIKKRIEEKIPVQYLINKSYFMGEEFYVDKNVLIPRPETEILVEEVLKRVKKNSRIIDIGSGSGCIAVMLAKKLNHCNFFASDISAKALKTAKINSEKHKVIQNITFIESDVFKNIDEKEKFDIIVSNPPYIPIKEKNSLQIEVSGHEPSNALFVEDDKGIEFYKKLAEQSFKRFNNDGFIAVETGFSQADEVETVFKKKGFNNIQIIKDFSEVQRVVLAYYTKKQA